MRNFLVFLFFSLFFKLAFASNEVSIELQWEENKNAAFYEIQLLDLHGNVVKIVESKSSLINMDFPRFQLWVSQV
mgnify:CR=1 FL=1